jgi:penicillin-binding protein 1A
MWIYFMRAALANVPESRVPQPPGLVSMRISAETGLAARPGDPNAIFETFMAGHLPPEAPSDGSLAAPFDMDAGQSQSDESLF